MNDFFKYLTIGDEIKDWGIYLNVAGKAKIEPYHIYPSKDHPTGYYFIWKEGRILQEYQLNYITHGSGILENETGRYNICPGTLMIIRKGCWHRYRPAKNEGWTEHYIGFNGELANRFLNLKGILREKSVVYCGIRDELLDTYYNIFNLVQTEDPGFQEIASGLVVKLLGHIVAIEKQQNFSGKQIENVIQKARFTMRENVEGQIDINKLAGEYNIGYSYFRRMFKKYTGVSPHHYHLDLKIMRAKELILTSDKSIKEICYDMGFQSVHYFSRYFKKKIGINPGKLKSERIK
jgi:AraC-like DNA-binding protein